MQPIVFTLEIEVPPEKREEVVTTLNLIIGPTEAQLGCLRCELNLSAANPNVLTLVEEWKSEEDLHTHIRSREFEKILALMDMSEGPPEIRIDKVSRRVGIDAIAAIRGKVAAPPRSGAGRKPEL